MSKLYTHLHAQTHAYTRDRKYSRVEMRTSAKDYGVYRIANCFKNLIEGFVANKIQQVKQNKQTKYIKKTSHTALLRMID